MKIEMLKNKCQSGPGFKMMNENERQLVMTLELIVWNGIKQDPASVIMLNLIHIWIIIKKLSLTLWRKPADGDFTNVYFRAVMGDFRITKSKNKQTNEWTKRNEKIEIRPLTKKEVGFIQKWVWNVISSANHTGRTNKKNDHPV